MTESLKDRIERKRQYYSAAYPNTFANPYYFGKVIAYLECVEDIDETIIQIQKLKNDSRRGTSLADEIAYYKVIKLLEGKKP